MNSTRGPPTFVISGKNYHLMGSLLPSEDKSAKFSQLYVVDTHNEIQNCMSIISESNAIHEDIVTNLKNMLDEHNILVKSFRMVRKSIGFESRCDVKSRLLGKRGKDDRRYNLPSANEVAALIVGDFDINKIDRDIVIETQMVYTIVFQKCGLPHAHILIFLHWEDKYPMGKDIDQIISAEIPNKDKDLEYFEAIAQHMMHGPCVAARKNSPYMENGKCIRHFPKKFVDVTMVDKDGYPVYRRRDDGKTINKSGIELDNRYVS
ncbi:hypothetical protein Ahy_Scaffold2g107541 [Arachis hypogaea]|uniref:Helitron helicase-like domain-containing protein n=1 Tax=Arachis hypogaea TaxID=3818 RepID=A0A444WQC0_ARAHY|nr:hypothetical protein Ahy_Scaffold2g107541 [Arachis hypogaea]